MKRKAAGQSGVSRRRFLFGAGAAALVLGAGANPASAAMQSLAPEPGPRVRRNLNGGWRFFGGDAIGAQASDFDDSGWADVALPHTWNVEDAFDDQPGYRRGVGWYRGSLTLGDDLAGKSLFLFTSRAPTRRPRSS